jgi:glycine hydroxymethyltransferase
MPNRIGQLMEEEAQRQAQEITLIASENYASKAVLDANGSVLNNKYAEGYAGNRYYAGNRIVDQIEREAIRLAQEAFATDYHVNVQPLSGSPANFAVYTALLKPGDTVLAMSLAHGGHLTHGHQVSVTGQLYNFVHYGVSKETELIDYDQVLALAKEHRPKLIVCGATAYPMFFDFAAFSRIAREVGAWLMVDMAHFAGLVAGKAHPTPFGYADVVTSTTHKTLRGPRSGIIFCRPEFAKAIDRAVFPGLQGGPHMHTIAAKAIALEETLQPSFQVYAKQVVQNAKVLAYSLQRRGFRLMADGTDTHLMLVDVTTAGSSGKLAQERLESIGMITNKNMLPFDPRTPNDPSGLRLGTPAVTSRGMKEKEMEEIADILSVALTSTPSPDDADLVERVGSLAKKFRIPAHY